MEKVDFYEWLLYECPVIDFLEDVNIKISPYTDWLPRYKEFVFWFFDYEQGFFYETSKNWFPFYNDEYTFVKNVEIKLKEYNEIEQVVYTYIILCFFYYCKQVSSNGVLYNRNKYIGKDIDEIDLFPNIISKIIKYYELKIPFLNEKTPLFCDYENNDEFKPV